MSNFRFNDNYVPYFSFKSRERIYVDKNSIQEYEILSKFSFDYINMIVFFSFKSREAKEDVGESREQPKKSISMGQIQPTGNPPPASGQIVQPPASGQLAGILAGL